MASVHEDEAKKKERMTAFLSELRIEGSSPTMVSFSDPCSYCGCKKRRCLHPPSRSRKKLLVFNPSNPSVQFPPSKSPIGRPENPSPSHLHPISLLRSFSDQIPHFKGSPAVISLNAPSQFPPAAANSFLPRDSGNVTPMSPPRTDEGKRLTGGSAAPPDHLGSLHFNQSTSVLTTEKKILPFKEEDDNKKKDGSDDDDEDGSSEEGTTPEACVGEREVKTTVKCKCGAVHEFVYRSA